MTAEQLAAIVNVIRRDEKSPSWGDDWRPYLDRLPSLIELIEPPERPDVTYTTRGPVRGECGHVHRTIGGALKCLRGDRRGCARQGGYSDRSVVRCDGEPMTQSDIEYINSL